MKEQNTAWFFLSFASLDFEKEDEVKAFLERWRIRKPKYVVTMLGYALKGTDEEFQESEVQSYVYYHFNDSLYSTDPFKPLVQETLSSMTDISQFYYTFEIPIEWDIPIVKGNANKLRAFQLVLNEYLEELVKVHEIRKKYDKAAADRYNSLLENEMKDFLFEYPYFSENTDPDRVIIKQYGHGQLPIAKPFGNKTDEFLQILPNLDRYYDRVKLGPDGKFYLEPVINPRSFELSVYAELHEYVQRNRYPVICAGCNRYIDNPSKQQMAIYGSEKSVLHKSSHKSAKEREEQSDCEIKYYRKKDNSRYEKKIKSKGDV